MIDKKQAETRGVRILQSIFRNISSFRMNCLIANNPHGIDSKWNVKQLNFTLFKNYAIFIKLLYRSVP